MNRKNSRIRKSVISYVISFVLALSIVGLVMLSSGKYSMLSIRAVMHTCEKIDYYGEMKSEITDRSYEMGIPYGVEKKALKKVFTIKQIKKDMTNVMKSRVEDEKYIVDTSSIGETMMNNIKTAYEDSGQIWTDKQEESMQEYVGAVEKMYIEKMSIPGNGYIANAINMSTRLAIAGIPLCIIIIVMCVFFLLSMRKYTHHGLRFIAYGVLGGGLTLVTVFAACISNGFIYRFNISDVYLRKFFTFYIGHQMLMFVFFGIFILIGGGVLVYVTHRFKISEEI